MHFVAGGGFAGFDATLVRDPEHETLRGVAVQWDDTGRPSLTDPMWRVVGRRVPCVGDATP